MYSIPMDTEELIRKCKAISIRDGNERKLSLRGGTQGQGGRIIANSLVGKFCWHGAYKQKESKPPYHKHGEQ